MSLGILGIPGSAETQERLARYLAGGRIHHSLLFVGPDRSSKLEIARRLARALLCRASSPTRPFCGVCSACRRIEKGLHPDVLVYEESEEDQIKIDAVRQLCHQMELGPTEGGAKVCIIDEAHRMNSAAANAFLKTLEEPGDNRYFWLLTTQPGSLLPTTKSRCVEFIFKPDAALAGNPELAAEYDRLLRHTLDSGDLGELLSAVEKDKEKCLGFLQHLQGELRAATIGEPSALAERPATRNLETFDEALKLEGRLRSHANYGLMLEVFVRRELL